MSDNILTKAEHAKTVEAKRLAAALVAFNTNIEIEPAARRLLVSVALGLTLAQVDAAFEDLIEVGAVSVRWLQ